MDLFLRIICKYTQKYTLRTLLIGQTHVWILTIVESAWSCDIGSKIGKKKRYDQWCHASESGVNLQECMGSKSVCTPAHCIEPLTKSFHTFRSCIKALPGNGRSLITIENYWDVFYYYYYYCSDSVWPEMVKWQVKGDTYFLSSILCSWTWVFLK